jgi:hypothetical protein
MPRSGLVQQAAGENADHADSFGHILTGVSQPGRWKSK